MGSEMCIRDRLWAGVAAAIIASIFVAIALNNIKESIGNESYTALFEGVFMYITAGLLWYLIFWLSRHVLSLIHI